MVTLAAALAGTAKAIALPVLGLARPHGVLVPQAEAVRQAAGQQEREEQAAGKAGGAGGGGSSSILGPKALVLRDGGLDAARLAALQYAFDHLAGGSAAAGMPADKIWQMLVRARLDPGAAAVRQLAGALQARVDAAAGMLGREAFLEALLHFRDSGKGEREGERERQV
jgi:hypothetical protein